MERKGYTVRIKQKFNSEYAAKLSEALKQLNYVAVTPQGFKTVIIFNTKAEANKALKVLKPFAAERYMNCFYDDEHLSAEAQEKQKKRLEELSLENKTSDKDVSDINVGNKTDTPAASESGNVLSSKELLKLGDIGRTVSVAQYALHLHGYEPSGSRKKNGDFDGEFGEGTSKAVKLFQLDKGLTVTGAIDEATFKALVEGGA